MKKPFIGAASKATLGHSLRNAPTWQQLWDSEDPRDRNACFEDDFIDGKNDDEFQFLSPRLAAIAAQPHKNSRQQQQRVRSAEDLEAQYMQQQVQQLQM